MLQCGCSDHSTAQGVGALVRAGQAGSSEQVVHGGCEGADLVGGRVEKRQASLDSILKKVLSVAFLNKTKLQIPENGQKKGYKVAYKVRDGRVHVDRSGDGWSALDKISFLAASPNSLQNVIPKTWEKMSMGSWNPPPLRPNPPIPPDSKACGP